MNPKFLLQPYRTARLVAIIASGLSALFFLALNIFSRERMTSVFIGFPWKFSIVFNEDYSVGEIIHGWNILGDLIIATLGVAFVLITSYQMCIHIYRYKYSKY